MYLFDTVLLGPLRLFLLFSGVLLLHQVITRQPISNYSLDYLVQRLTLYCAFLLILIFVLIQLGIYDIFSLLLVMFVFFLLIYFQSKNPLHIIKGIAAKRSSFLLSFFKFIERDISPKKLFKNNQQYLYPKKINYLLLCTFMVAFTTFISRYLFLSNDLYTLSDLWIKNLDKVKGFNAGGWFQKGLDVNGELAFINFYAKITSISEEMALHSFGLIESFALATILYWLLKKMMRSKFIAPITAVLFFALFYRYLPININLLLEHNPLYFGFCFALPAMVYSVKSKSFKNSKKVFFMTLLALYLAIGFTSFFVYFIVLPVFFLPAWLFSTKKSRGFLLKSCLAYLVSIAISFLIYYGAAFKAAESFKEFLLSNFIQINSYTYFPQLIISLDQLLLIYTIIGWFIAGFLVVLYIKKKDKWMPALVFQLFFNAFILLKNVDAIWFDLDLYYQSMAILIVISFGILVGMVVHFFKLSMPKKPVLRGLSLATFFLALFVLSYLTNGFFKYNAKEAELLKVDILEVYDQLSDKHLPFTYAVVNQSYGQNLSTNTHHFITYEDFTKGYAQRDSIYNEVKNEKQLLKLHPEYILPESVFVFMATHASNNSKYDLETPKDVKEKVQQELVSLQSKGRNVQLFYRDNYLEVYQIINKEKASNINDLIFGL